jgi:hypothetical protein
LISRFILDLREEFAVRGASIERTFDISDMTTIQFAGQREEPSECHEETTDNPDKLWLELVDVDE